MLCQKNSAAAVQREEIRPKGLGSRTNLIWPRFFNYKISNFMPGTNLDPAMKNSVAAKQRARIRPKGLRSRADLVWPRFF